MGSDATAAISGFSSLQVANEVVIRYLYFLLLEELVLDFKVLKYSLLQFVVDSFGSVDAVNDTHAGPEGFREVHLPIVAVQIQDFNLLFN